MEQQNDVIVKKKKKRNAILGCLNRTIFFRLREIIIPLYCAFAKTRVMLHSEHQINFCLITKGNIF